MNKNKVYRKRRQKRESSKLIQEAFKRIFAPHIKVFICSTNPAVLTFEDK